MKNIFLLSFLSTLVSLVISRDVYALSYYPIPAAVGIVDANGYDDCTQSSNGYVASGGSTCRLYFPVNLPSGTSFYGVELFYYDNSGSQSVSTYFKYKSLTSTSSATTLDSFSDTATSASIQSDWLSYTSSLSSSYSYFVVVELNYGSRLNGIWLVTY